jgi:hypothetical protein
MSSVRRIAMSVLAVLLVAGAASAQTAALPADVTIDEVLRLLIERSPRTIADRASIDVAAADRVTARIYPNPDISYGATHLVSGLG